MDNAFTKYQHESKQAMKVRFEPPVSLEACVRIPPLLPICSVSRCTSSIQLYSLRRNTIVCETLVDRVLLSKL